MKTATAIDTKTHRLLMGNEAMARGLIEAGVSLAASYPGTPASEILTAVVAFAKEEGLHLHAEWSVNEKVAYETALANAMTGRRSAVAMKQVGLNVASDPFMRSAYLGVIGGLVLIAADDPGPHSSQTEQDSRFFAMFARVPVLDPASPQEAKDLVARAFELSEKYEIPVMLRPTTRVCHARQNVTLGPPLALERPARFEKNPGRWCATPHFLRELHRQLNDKIEAISREPDLAPLFTPGDGSFPGPRWWPQGWPPRTPGTSWRTWASWAGLTSTRSSCPTPCIWISGKRCAHSTTGSWCWRRPTRWWSCSWRGAPSRAARPKPCPGRGSSPPRSCAPSWQNFWRCR